MRRISKRGRRKGESGLFIGFRTMDGPTHVFEGEQTDSRAGKKGSRGKKRRERKNSVRKEKGEKHANSRGDRVK